MLLIDHTAVEPHAQSLSALAMAAIAREAQRSAVKTCAGDVGHDNSVCGAQAAAAGFLRCLSRTMRRLNQPDKLLQWFLAAIRCHPLPAPDPALDPTLAALRFERACGRVCKRGVPEQECGSVACRSSPKQGISRSLGYSL